MGNITDDLLIWTPDDQDTAEPDVYLATMAQSLEDGVGERLRKQERSASLLANLPANQNFTVGTPATVNFTINAAVGYNDEMTLTGGKVKVTEAGVYFFSANVLGAVAGTSGTGFMQMQIRKNTKVISNSITLMMYNGGSVIATATGSTVTTCAVDDLIDVYVAFYNTPAAPFLSSGGGIYNLFSASLLKAT